MLTFYYHPFSPIARRVWLALLEKKIPFEPILVDLRGEQLKPEFLEINPFHHVPVIIDNGFRLIESLAILDYLESKYPQPSFLPNSAEAIGKMRMVQMLTVNELMPKIPLLINAEGEAISDQVTKQIEVSLEFLHEQLGKSEYFGGESLNLADLVAGATIPLLTRLGISLASHPQLQQWQQKLMIREAWKITELSESDFKAWRRFVKLISKKRSFRPS